VPITQLQNRQARLQSKTGALADLREKVGAFKTAADALRSAGNLRAFTVTASDETILTAAASSAAGEGSHTVVVNQLAAAHRMVNTGHESLETLVGAGTFAYAYNGTTRTIQTTADTMLQDLRDLINNDGGNPGVTASILEYDAGGGHVFHLVLGGNDTGADCAVTIDDQQTTIEGFESADFTVTQAAQDSQVRVDGYPSGDWISRSTNTISDVLPGLTLHLQSAGTATINLTRDTASLKEKVQALVTAYNNMVDYARKKTAYDTAAKTGGILMGEYAVTATLHTLRMPLVGAAAGFQDGQDAYTLAAQAGLSADRDGRLQLDEKVFDEAVADNYLGVLALLGADRTGASDSEYLRFYGAGRTTTPGFYDVEATFAGGVLQSARIKLTSEPESAYRAATVQGGVIIGAAGQPERNLQVAASYSGSGTVTAAVRVRQGLAGALYDNAKDVLDETLEFAGDAAQDGIDRLQGQIDREEARLLQLENQLKAQYARLEEALTLLAAQRNYWTIFASA